MNKTAIKNFAIWARNKLIAEITYKAGLLGITGEGIKTALPQSGNGTEYYDIGTKEPYAITGAEIKQRQDLVTAIRTKQAGSDYKSAYEQIIDEVAYTWFNRLIAIRFMEVNDYLPSRIRVLSSVSGKNEPDIVTTPFEADMEYTDAERAQIIGWKNDEKLDEAFRYLFLKQCNELNEVLPALFEKVSDYTELLLTVSFTDKDGVVYHLVHDISEDDFNVEIGGQVEIIGWLYQYYNTEPKAKVFARASGTKIKKEEIPAATQLFTPDWIVRYMVENSLGRIFISGQLSVDSGQSEEERICQEQEIADRMGWKYYIPEAAQEPDVRKKLDEIKLTTNHYSLTTLTCVDPCMGSGHILCYFFDVLMQIYESQGYGERDAAQSILEHNIWGLDIDDRAYQLAYFAVMMKARQYDRRILTRGIQPHVYAIVESNGFNRAQLKYFGATLDDFARNNALNQVNGLLEQLYDAKEYGSILTVDQMDWALLREFAEHIAAPGQLDLDSIGVEDTQAQLKKLIDVGEALAQKYSVTCTNPPYMGGSGMDGKLSDYVKKNYPDSKSDLFAVMMQRVDVFTVSKGYTSLITMESWMFLSSFERLRSIVNNTKTIINMVHMPYLGKGGTSLGINFGTAAVIMMKGRIPKYTGQYEYTVYYECDENGVPFQFPTINERWKTAQQDNFSKIPGSPVAYWVGDGFYKAFVDGVLLENLAHPKKGLATTDNNRFLRLWPEVDFDAVGVGYKNNVDAQKSHCKWFPLNKGGEYRRWYGNKDYLVNWYDDGAEMKAAIIKRYNGGSYTKEIRSEKMYFSDSVTWSALTTGTSSFRFSDYGALFDSAGSSMFPQKELHYLIALLNSKVTDEILKFINPTMNYGAGTISNIPVLQCEEYKALIESYGKQNISLSKDDWDSFENSWDFLRHPLVRPVSTIAEAYAAWSEECDTRFNQLKANEEELNRIFIDIYGLQDELTPEVEDKDVTVRKADLQRDVKSLLSYAVGCMFGRYSLDVPGLAYAGGEWDDSKYSTFIPDKDGVIPITDEEYFDDDIVGLLCAWLKKVYGADTLEKNLDFIAAALGNKGDSSREIIRNYFLNDFFKDHCSTYSVTGSGKRPIYWLYDSGKQNGFKALIYLHRYDADTTGRVRANYLHRMEKVYESEIGRMTETIENSQNNREVAKATKRREKLQKQLKECREYDEKIAHLALARIEIDLDDGVKVNYRKVQTDKNGKFYEILADSKNIMSKK